MTAIIIQARVIPLSCSCAICGLRIIRTHCRASRVDTNYYFCDDHPDELIQKFADDVEEEYNKLKGIASIADGD